MAEILFTTTNEGKLNEARRVLQGIEIVGEGLDIPEIQSLDTQKVAVEKAKAYFAELKRPLFVEDVSLTFTSLNGLPGTYINDFSKALGNDGLVSLLQGKDDRGATAKTTLAYVDEKGEVHVFEGVMEGTIALSPKGENGFGWDPIFIPAGFDKTLAEMTAEEKDKVSMRAKALQEMRDWLQTNTVA